MSDPCLNALPRSADCLRTAHARRDRLSGRRARGSKGFTLVEMMVTIAVLTILGAAATYTFSNTISGYRIANQANGLARDLQFARGEAVKRGQQVVVCASSDGATCSGSTAWEGGWIVFADGADGNSALDNSDPVLRAETQNPGRNTLRPDLNTVSQVVFNRQGSTVNQPLVTFALHDPTVAANLTRCVAVSPSGRATTISAGTGACS